LRLPRQRANDGKFCTDGFIDPCIPTLAAKPPSGSDRAHEVKHDGYRLIGGRDRHPVYRLATEG
jgi:ATP-dependent DNA ligase